MKMARGSTVLTGALVACALVVAAAVVGADISQQELQRVAQLTPPAQVHSAPGSLAEEVVFFEEPNRSKAYEMLASGQMHIYAYGLSDPEIKRRIETSKDLRYTLSYGNTWELTINPSGPVLKNGKLNPFAVAPIREALNWLIDRHYIAQELCFGLARPKFLPIVSAFPDYARLADVARAVEFKYAHNPGKAKEVLTREMQQLGAIQKDGKWWYKNAPVDITFLIRTEDVRKRMGDYIATLLEGLGFTVDRQYKTAAEAGPIWIGSDPSEGRWHLYTGGWINTLISRDQGNTFNYYYTPKGRPDTLWQAYNPSPRFAEIADRLARNDYTSWPERMQLMAEALQLANLESFRVWLVDAINYFPLRKDVGVVSDLAGGIHGSALWAHTLRFLGQPAARMRIGMPSILTEPWNPIAGSNWIYDQMIIRGTAADPNLPDPFTGLFLPHRVQSAHVTAQEGVPVIKTLDWVDLSFVPTIAVPGEAWIGWDVPGQRFITVQEKHPDGLQARTKTVVRYVDDLTKRRWHDGSPQALADFLLSVIIGFERPSQGSAIFDAAAVPAFQTFVQYFRGVKIVQDDPLVVEFYSDQTSPDAEWVANSAAAFVYSTTPWHSLALGILAESHGRLAFSADKAEKLKIERMSYIAGPSLPILEEFLKKAEAEGYVPYEKALGKYVTVEQAKQRYAALRQWYTKNKHLWVGNGPYAVESVHPLEKTVVVRRFDEFRAPDPRWLSFAEPRVAQVAVAGPARVTIGTPAEFRITVSFQETPYPVKDIDFVKFLVFDARGEVALVADAEAVKDGEWVAKLPADTTRELKPGSNQLEVAVAPKVVSLASFGSARFVSLGGR
jgi:peptide/nickel transport system substrate-binding protein